MLAIKLDDVHHVALDEGARQRAGRFRLQVLLEFLVFELFIASKARRSIVGFSTTVTNTRSPARVIFTSLNRPVA
jgi:hypothetical protein